MTLELYEDGAGLSHGSLSVSHPICEGGIGGCK